MDVKQLGQLKEQMKGFFSSDYILQKESTLITINHNKGCNCGQRGGDGIGAW